MFSFLVNKYLLPIRKQVYELISKNSSVLDLGCGMGNQLVLLSGKIKDGLGIDTNKRKIEIANKQGKLNLEFLICDAKDFLKQNKQKFDYVICSMFLHSLNRETREKIINSIPAKNLIVVDYVKSPSATRNYLMHFEELFSGHYENFREYLKEDNDFGESMKTFDSGINIWIL